MPKFIPMPKRLLILASLLVTLLVCQSGWGQTMAVRDGGQEFIVPDHLTWSDHSVIWDDNLGTGCIIKISGQPYVLSCAHKDHKGNPWAVGDKVGFKTFDEQHVSATVIAVDVKEDASIYRIDSQLSSGAGFRQIAKTPASAGDHVHVIGFPVGKWFNDRPAVVAGYSDDGPRLKLHGGGTPGESGAPVLNAAGEIVGVFCESDDYGNGPTLGGCSEGSAINRLVEQVSCSPDIEKCQVCQSCQRGYGNSCQSCQSCQGQSCPSCSSGVWTSTQATLQPRPIQQPPTSGGDGYTPGIAKPCNCGDIDAKIKAEVTAQIAALPTPKDGAPGAPGPPGPPGPPGTPAAAADLSPILKRLDTIDEQLAGIKNQPPVTPPAPAKADQHIVIVADHNATYWQKLSEAIAAAGDTYKGIEVAPPPANYEGNLPQAFVYENNSPVRNVIGQYPIQDLLARLARGDAI